MTTSLSHDTRDLAETYDRRSDSQFAGGKRLVERLGLAADARVLDVGCGTGRLARWIAESVAPAGRVVGIDPLPERVAIARAHAPTLTFEVGQAEDLSAFADQSFDAVCMSAVIHWVDDKPKALAEARRVLGAGGHLGLTTLPRELTGSSSVGRALLPILGRAPYAGRVDLAAFDGGHRWVTTTDLITMIVDAGLELTALHVVPRSTRFESGAALVAFLEASSFGNFTRIVPEDLRDSLRHDLATSFDAGSAGGVDLKDFGMAAVATRV
jgi:arsenite methyltransferase